MWSRGITAVALCVTCIAGALAALPGPAGARANSGQDGLMRALELAPLAVANWEKAHDGRAPAQTGSKRQVKSRPDPFRITIFAGSSDHGHLGDPAGRR